MAVATLSAAGRINAGLRELQCSGRCFIDIARELGAPIGTGSFSEWSNGKKHFDHRTENKLLEVLARLKELRDAIHSAKDANGSPLGFFLPDWSKTEAITQALVMRTMSQVVNELGYERSTEFSQMVDEATARTK
jgi:hypothetical protein